MMKSKSDVDTPAHEYIYDADSGHTVRVFAGRTAEKQASFFLPYLKPGMTLLDCGCGSGSITLGLAKAVEPGEVIGIDVSESEIRRAQDRATDKNITNIRFETGDLCRLDVPDNIFDALYSNNVLEHIPDIGRALRELYRMLKPGGIIGLRNMDGDGCLLGGDDELLEKILSVYGADYENEGGHFRIGRELGRLLLEAGLIEVNMTASYDIFSGPERCRVLAQSIIEHISTGNVSNHLLRSGIANLEYLEAMKKSLEEWQEFPYAFFAQAECEAIGRKPK